MDLENRSVSARTARTLKTGQQTVEISAGERLTIETSPGGTEVLDEAVPTGKVWSVLVRVDITETDA